MKVTIVHNNSGVNKKYFKLYDDFIKFLQKEIPLKYDLTIYFLGNREGSMTTGQRNDKNEIKVLSKGRLNRDILRTLIHEWVHEYQRTILNRDKGPDIGGENEDEANAKSGSIMKKYEKSNPENTELMYK
jgi:hypothetical protein